MSDSALKVKIFWVCAPSKKHCDYEAEDIYMEMVAPFLPPIGSHIQVHKDGELGKVDDIYIDLWAGVDGQVLIYLEEPDAVRPWKEMKAQGWKLDGD